MRPPLTTDDVEELEERSHTPEEHRRAAAILAGWAGETRPEDDDVDPAYLLVTAGDQLHFAGDDAAALEMFRRAVAVRGDTPPDKRCYLHKALMQAGLVAEANELAQEVRRAGPDNPDVYSFMAENYELAGDLHEALRWLSRGWVRAERTGVEDFRVLMLVVARRRVRRALGYPPDEIDASLPENPGRPLDDEV